MTDGRSATIHRSRTLDGSGTGGRRGGAAADDRDETLVVSYNKKARARSKDSLSALTRSPTHPSHPRPEICLDSVSAAPWTPTPVASPTEPPSPSSLAPPPRANRLVRVGVGPASASASPSPTIRARRPRARSSSRSSSRTTRSSSSAPYPRPRASTDARSTRAITTDPRPRDLLARCPSASSRAPTSTTSIPTTIYFPSRHPPSSPPRVFRARRSVGRRPLPHRHRASRSAPSSTSIDNTSTTSSARDRATAAWTTLKPPATSRRRAPPPLGRVDDRRRVERSGRPRRRPRGRAHAVEGLPTSH